jgi:hypothetical protein
MSQSQISTTISEATKERLDRFTRCVAKPIEIRPLAKDDDRSGFSCGKPDRRRGGV